MTAPITSKDVALAKREAAATGVQLPVGKFPAHIQAQLDERKTMSRVAAAIAGMSWGRELNLEARVAIARWGQQHNIDVTTEIDILGSKPYLNGRFYLNRAAELQRAGVIAYMRADNVTADARLDALAQSEDAETTRKAKAERDRRAMARIEYGAPDKAACVIVARIGVRRGQEVTEFAAAKWTGNGTRERDPVGDKFPVETAETRAYRRALRLLVSHVPHMKAWVDASTDDGEIIVEAIAESIAETAAANVDDAHLLKGGTRMVATEPYDDDAAQAEYVDQGGRSQ